MTNITITLDDHSATALQSLAETSGLTAEQFLARQVESLVAVEYASDEEFEKAAQYVMEKNAELYRRLA